jgi:hypothetical protein
VEELEKENENSRKQIEEMHEKLNMHSFTPLKPKYGIKTLVNNNDAKDKKKQTFEKDVELAHSVSSYGKNLSKTKSVMSTLR